MALKNKTLNAFIRKALISGLQSHKKLRVFLNLVTIDTK